MSAPTARWSSSAPSAQAAFRRAIQASCLSAASTGWNARVPMATRAAAASSPGLVRFSSPPCDHRRPQIVPSTGDPSASIATSGPMASTARSPSSRKPQAARVRTIASVAAISEMSSLAWARRLLDRKAAALVEGDSRQERAEEQGTAKHVSDLRAAAGWDSGWDSDSGSGSGWDSDSGADWADATLPSSSRQLGQRHRRCSPHARIVVFEGRGDGRNGALVADLTECHERPAPDVDVAIADDGDQGIDRGTIAHLAERDRRPCANARLGIFERLHQRRRGPRVGEVAERRDDLKLDVRLLILERLDQSRNRSWIAQLAERRRGLPADARVAVLEREDQSVDGRLARAVLGRDSGELQRPGRRFRRAPTRDRSHAGLTMARPTPRQMALDLLSVRKKTASGLMTPLFC